MRRVRRRLPVAFTSSLGRPLFNHVSTLPVIFHKRPFVYVPELLGVTDEVTLEVGEADGVVDEVGVGELLNEGSGDHVGTEPAATGDILGNEP